MSSLILDRSVVQPCSADYEFIKKLILLFRTLSSWFLNLFTLTASYGRLFHLLMRLEHKRRIALYQCYCAAWPVSKNGHVLELGTCWGASVKKFWRGTEAVPCDILYSSINPNYCWSHKILVTITGRISDWMTFALSSFAHKKRITESCSLRDAFSGYDVDVIVIKMVLKIKIPYKRYI